MANRLISQLSAYLTTGGGDYLTDEQAYVGVPVLDARVLDFGLDVLDSEADQFWLCSAEPTTYTEATNTFALGSKVFSAGRDWMSFFRRAITSSKMSAATSTAPRHTSSRRTPMNSSAAHSAPEESCEGAVNAAENMTTWTLRSFRTAASVRSSYQRNPAARCVTEMIEAHE